MSEAAVTALPGSRSTSPVRQSRSDRTRDAVLNAFLALVEEGDLSPTADRVAQRSQVSLRTVYHQFDDLETLHRLAGERLYTRVRELTVDLDTSLPTLQRVDAYVRQRVTVFDVLHPLSSAARVREPFSPVLRANRDEMLRLGERNVQQVFGPEIAALSEPQARRLVVAVGLVTNWSAWYALLEELHQGRGEAIAVMRATVRALLATPEQLG